MIGYLLVYSPSIVTAIIAAMTALRLSVTSYILGAILIITIVVHVVETQKLRHDGRI